MSKHRDDGSVPEDGGSVDIERADIRGGGWHILLVGVRIRTLLLALVAVIARAWVAIEAIRAGH